MEIVALFDPPIQLMLFRKNLSMKPVLFKGKARRVTNEREGLSKYLKYDKIAFVWQEEEGYC